MPLGSNTKFYETPNHPFQGQRIDQEADMLSRYGLKNKEELWRSESELRGYRREARRILGQIGEEELTQRERDQFLSRLVRLGILSETDGLDAVLGLDVTDILERRLQTVAYRQGLAHTPQQARQFIGHGHITVDGARVTIPSYKISTAENDTIDFDDTSPLTDDLHPERAGEQE
jgi:small subunit ribosomal protein S4